MRKTKKGKLLYCLNIIFKSSIASALIFFCYSVIMGIAPVLLVKAEANFIDKAVKILKENRDYREIISSMVYLLVLIGVFWITKSLNSLIKTFLTSKVRVTILPEIMRKKASLEYSRYEDKKVCDAMKLISKDPEKTIVEGFSDMLILASDVVMIASLFGMIFAYSYKSALVIMIITIPLSVLAVKSGQENYKVEKENVVYERTGDNFNNILRNREYSNERALFKYTNEFNSRAYKNNEKWRKVLMKTRFKWFMKMKLSSVIIAGISFGVTIVLLRPLRDGIISIGLFTALITAVFKLVNKLSWEITSVLDNLAKRSEYFYELSKFMNMDEEHQKIEKLERVEFKNLEFRDVYFKYPNSSRYILEGVSFKIEKGKHYALIGVNGAGKTTIIKLMMGLYKDYKGSIYVNGTDIKKLSRETLRRIFSVVFQDFAKYGISMKENIALSVMGEENIDDRVESIVKELNMESIRAKSSKGLDMTLGKLDEKSVDLSHGQWQRIAIARAVIKNSDVYILDEPCSALDPLNEKKLYAEYQNLLKDKTSISITHRLGAIQIAHEIIVIHGGKVISTGEHRELHKKCGLYRDMYEKQKGWYEHA